MISVVDLEMVLAGKQKGRHPDRALSPIGLHKKQPGRYADGNGLYLVVDKSGAKRWIMRTTVKGRRHDFGLGGLREVGLAEAREKTFELRKLIRDGGDPLTEKRARKQIPNFEEAARKVFKDREAAWGNKKHVQQWIQTLETYVFPFIGSKPVDQIDTPDVLQVLAPIWLSKPETARRLRQRIKTVFAWAKAAGFRSSENPVEGVSNGLPKQTAKVKHHAALPHQDIPAFIAAQRDSTTPATLAFEFLILTATRTMETLALSWGEIDNDVWKLPAERTKAKREIHIPLGPRCLEILDQSKVLSQGEHFVFPGSVPGKPLSNMVFLQALKRMGLRGKVTGHGFRSTFTDWAHDTTNFKREAIEMALNHTIKDKTEAAYRRGDLFNRRRELMLAWEAFCCSAV